MLHQKEMPPIFKQDANKTKQNNKETKNQVYFHVSVYIILNIFQLQI